MFDIEYAGHQKCFEHSRWILDVEVTDAVVQPLAQNDDPL